MSFSLASIVGGGIAEPIKAIGNVLDKLFTSDDERLTHDEVLTRLAQRPNEVQAEINKVEAQHRSIFVAGWRPFIGWVCGIGFLYDILIRPIANGFGLHFPPIDTEMLKAIVFALLGLGAYRTIEKIKNKTK